MNHYDKSEEEYRILKLFIEHYHDFPAGKLIKTESPDFILKLSNKESIGIELTQLNDPSVPGKDNQAGFNGRLTKEILESAILKKEEKIKLYKKRNTGKLWLVLTTENISSSTPYNINNKIGNWIFRSSFHKIFLFELSSNRIFELK